MRLNRRLYSNYLGGFFSAFLISFILLSIPAFATGYRINSGQPKVNESSIAMSGSAIVWEDTRAGGKSQIYFRDLNSSAPDAAVNESASPQLSPAVSGTKVVWVEDNDIWYKDLTGGSAVRLTTTAGANPKREPTIYGNRIAWSEQHNGYYLVYTKLLTEPTGAEIAVDGPTTTANQLNPALSEKYIVWEVTPITGTDLRIKNLSAGFLPADFCAAYRNQYEPSITDNIVVWTDTRNSVSIPNVGSSSQIFYYDLNNGQPAVPATTGNPVSSSLSIQKNPTVSANRIAWSDTRTGDTTANIYIKDMLPGGVETAAVTDANNQVYPVLGGDKLAWQTYNQSMSDWGFDIMLARAAGGLTVFATGFETGSVSDPSTGWSVFADQAYANAWWGESTVKKKSGTKALWMAQQGGNFGMSPPWYVNNMSAYASRYIDLTGFNQASLDFYYWAQWSNDSDHLVVQYSLEGDSTLRDFTEAHLDRNTSIGGAWTKKTIDLSSVAGKRVKLIFHAVTDSSNTSEGIYIDDLTVTGATVWPFSRIALTPGSAAMPVGAAQIFSADAQDSFGNSVTAPIINWSATGGNVTPASGLSATFTAGTVAGSAFKVTAASGAISADAAITVTPGTLNHIHVTPSPADVEAHGTQGFTAQGQDIYNNDIPGLIYNWSTNAGPSVVPATGASTTLTAQNLSAAGKRVTVTSGTKTAYAVVNIVPASLHHIVITPASFTVIAHGTQVFSAQGYDAYDNPITGLAYDWTTDAGGVAPTSGVSTTLTAQNTVAAGKNVSVSSDGVTGTAAVNITAGSLDHLIISPATTDVAAHGTQTFTAQGYDAYSNAISGLILNWTTDAGTVTPTPGTSTTLIAQNSAAAGKRVTVSSGAKTAFALVNVVPAVLNHIDITPASASVAAHGTQVFSAQGYDAYDNPITGLTYDWTTDGGGVAPTSGVSTTLTAQDTVASGKNVSVSSGGVTGIASVDIVPGALAGIDLSPVSVSVPAHGTRVFSAQGQDAYGNQILSGVTYNWATDAGTLSSPTGSSVTLTAQATVSAGKMVSVSSGGLTYYAVVNITTGPLNYIQLVPISGDVMVHSQVTFMAQGFDADSNPVPGLTYHWTTEGETYAGTLSAAYGSSTTLTAQDTAGAGKRVTVSTGTATAYATLNITAGPLDHISVSPNPVSVGAHGTQAFAAQGYDVYDNPVSGRNYDWESVVGSVSDVPGPSTTFTAQNTVGTGSVTASIEGIRGSTDVSVVAGPLNHIQMTPAAVDVAAHGTQLISAAGYDAYDNLIDGLSFDWTTDAGIVPGVPGLSTTLTAQNTAAAGKSVTAALDGVSAFTAVNIVPGPLNHIVVTPASPTVTAHGSQLFTGHGYDIYNNEISGLAFNWTTNAGPTISPASGASATLIAQDAVAATGKWVRADFGGKTGQANVAVVAGAVTHIHITPSSADVHADETQVFSAEAQDAYDNAVSGTPLNWATVGDTSAGTLSAASGSSTTLTARTTAAPGKIITVSSGAISADAAVNIVSGALSRISISPATVDVAAHGTQVFTAQGYDAFNNPVSGRDYTWGTGIGAVSDAPGHLTILTAQNTVGIGSVTASFDGIIGTADVSVVAGSLNHIYASPTSATVFRGQTAVFTARGQDAYNNDIPGLIYSWHAGSGSFNPSRGAGTTYMAPAAGLRDTITVSSGSITSAPIPVTLQLSNGPVLTTPDNTSFYEWGPLNFSWTIAQVPDATGYAIELCSKNPDTNGEANNAVASKYRIGASVLPSGASTTYPGSTVGLSGTYYWRIIAIKNGQLYGVFSDARAFTVTAPRPALTAPANAAATAQGPLAFSWTFSAGSAGSATGYAIELCSQNPDTHNEANNGVASIYRIGASILPSGASTTYPGSTEGLSGTYYWRIIAIKNGQLFGVFSNARSFTVTPKKPVLSAPANAAIVAKNSPLAFKWTFTAPANGPATGYAIELLSRAPAPGEANNRAASIYRIGASILPSGSSTTYPGSTAGLSDTYYWRIIAIKDGQLYGVFSDARSFTVAP